ncbi:MAG TPA: Flp family type IVb pilin [Dehalococcoidia bacterium]|nr:Flp family type IVb pilin [Dehalococcoidia bacterium]
MFSTINEALRKFFARVQDETGQALAEYGLIIALVAVVLIVGLGVLAGGISGVFSSIASALGGATTTTT